MSIFIFDELGNVIDQKYIKLLDDADNKSRPLKCTRVTPSIRFKNIFYKGIGSYYCGHSINEITPQYKFRSLELPPYIKYSVSKTCFEMKTGIFKERFQPYFSDYIGGCGPKESAAISNCKEMPSEILGVSIKEVIPLFEDHSFYINEYKNERKSYEQNINGFEKLLEFISSGKWYTAWDKNLIRDLDCEALIQDPADWKKENTPNFYHTLGTMYSLWYSLYKRNITSFIEHASLYFPLIETSPNKLVMLPLLSAIVINRFNSNIVPEEYKGSNYGIVQYQKFMVNIIKNNPACCQLQDPNYPNYKPEDYLKLLLPSTVAMKN